MSAESWKSSVGFECQRLSTIRRTRQRNHDENRSQFLLTSPNADAASYSVTSCPFLFSAIAVDKPPIPAPTTTTLSLTQVVSCPFATFSVLLA
jgi:hypothetical protein